MQRFDEMGPALEKYGVSIIALSKDTVEEAAVHKERDNLALTLLSDAQLKVIRQYGVEHHKAFGFKTESNKMFGIPMGSGPSFKEMAIPTTLIIDEDGIIRWIDQTDDYRLRSDNARVFNAVETVFGKSI